MTRHLLSISLLGAMCLWAIGPALAEETKFDRKLEVAGEVYLELMSAPDRRVPQHLLDNAKCIGVIPSVYKGALFSLGGRHGNGIASCRNADGVWSPPSFIEISGGSIGLQIGGEAIDLVLFFMNERGVQSLLGSKFELGGGASVAAGPVGRTAEAGTDVKLKAEIYSYARSRGLFAGLSAEGSYLAADKKANRRYYGEAVDAESILFDHRVPTRPASASRFTALLP
ncbi:MAG: lipid-binding SYLF domain-containing protein [Thermoanaerobaculia bacterium]